MPLIITRAGGSASAFGGLGASVAPPVAPNDYESIMTAIVSTPTPTISFTAIPQTYKHLQIRGIARDARTVNVNTLNMRVGNGGIDSGANYSAHSMDGDGTTALGNGTSSYTQMSFMILPGANATANAFGCYVFDILDYTSTNKNKTVRGIGGADVNGSGNAHVTSGAYLANTAITDIQFFTNGNFNFVQYSSFALYGIKG